MWKRADQNNAVASLHVPLMKRALGVSVPECWLFHDRGELVGGNCGMAQLERKWDINNTQLMYTIEHLV